MAESTATSTRHSTNDAATERAQGQSSNQPSMRPPGGDIHGDIYTDELRSRLGTQTPTTAASSARSGSGGSRGVTKLAPINTGATSRPYVLRKFSSYRDSAVRPLDKGLGSFLDLYGGNESDESDDDEAADGEANEPAERRPLLSRRRTTTTTKGDAGLLKTFFTLLKAFVGTGILFLPKAFRNGGILFSSMTLVGVASLSYVCFCLLLACRDKYKGGYGDIGASVGGTWLRRLILASIFISQMGFVCAGLIFTADNLHAVIEAVLPAEWQISVRALVALQLIALIPLALIRNVSKLGPVAFAADAFIFAGLIYIWWYSISTLGQQGVEPSVELFNTQDFVLTIGSTIFTFEGIGLVLPIRSSMAEPQKFNKLLLVIMFLITCIFTSIGALCYTTFGDATGVEIFSNFNSHDRLVNAIQFLYALAVLAGGPIQLFPAIHIVEIALFDGESGKKSAWVKWKKNGAKAALAGLCALIAAGAASDLDKFVALSGSFACIPLVYIYPPLLHLRGVAKSRAARILDYSIAGFGVLAMGFTTCITVYKWSQ